ncbi:motile sperm domain-containing protein 1-like [Amphiura filiformis]|uniref:motile sperm domain-containing protein 1-like n=1 Tax=Amphiura filiformis TaxID=82378 RepID=UPI003B21E52B
MQLERQPRLVDGQLPIFVFPTELVYFADDPSSHKQVLTLYNPYEFSLRFKVLCTSPKRYSVVDSEGTVRPGCCIDIVIRHKEISESNYGRRDRFRLNIYEQGRRQAIGRKDISAILLPNAREDSDELETASHSTDPGNVLFTTVARPRTSPGATVVLLAVVCIVALMLPTQGEKQSHIPEYLHLTVNQKLIAAYVLGLVTMVILRT